MQRRPKSTELENSNGQENKTHSHCSSGCESGYRTTAQNGQYRGLFQMGSSERQLFGHGVSALAQAQAAYRYFVRSGRDWSPWSCKPWS